MPATGMARINRTAAPIGNRRGRGHGPLLLSMIGPNGPWLSTAGNAAPCRIGIGGFRRAAFNLRGHGVLVFL